jgi:hypothetical protein
MTTRGRISKEIFMAKPWGFGETYGEPFCDVSLNICANVCSRIALCRAVDKADRPC